MLKLTNISTLKYEYENFNNNHEEMKNFLQKHTLDGFELIQYSPWNKEMLPQELVKGLHMKFFPIWLDFWRGNMDEVQRQFGELEVASNYYGGVSRDAIVKQYKEELATARRIGVKYVVFHVGHVKLEHVYDYKFSYSDEEIVEAAIELVNEVFTGEDEEIMLLFENVWWPGLTMQNYKAARRLIEGTDYGNKGFMLDTAHLMNTNLKLRTDKEVLAYLYDTIKSLGDLKKYIKGIHLNYSLSGAYVEGVKACPDQSFKDMSFNDRYIKSFEHIIRIDEHKPFLVEGAKEFVEYIAPEFLIYEFINEDFSELNKWIEKQNEILGL